jgi:hypothetical protein
VKKHVGSIAMGGLVVPIALSLATLIANEAQTLLGLHLDNIALSLYLIPFLVGAAAVLAALIRLEGTKIGGELGDAIGALGSLLAPPPASTEQLPPVQAPAEAVTSEKSPDWPERPPVDPPAPS